MFCNQCGGEMQTHYNVCPRCGKPAQTVAPAVASKLQHHLQILGVMWMIVGSFCFIPALGLIFLSSVVHIAIPFSDAVARTLGPLVLMIIGGSLFLVGAGGVLVGWGLMQHQSWARILAIIIGVLALFHPPLLTLLGIYTLWVLLGQDTEVEYQRLARTA